MFELARSLEDQGFMDRAIQEYARLAALQGAGAEVLMRKGLLHRQLGDLADAAECFRQAQAVEPGDPYPLMRLGQLAEDLGRPMAAAVFMRQATQVAGPGAGMALQEMQVNLTAAYSRLQWLDAAYRVARALPQGLPDWWAGAQEKAYSEYKAARSSAQALLRSHRIGDLSSDEYLTLARAMLALGRLRAAKAICVALIARHPDHFVLSYFMADVIAREFGPAEALEHLRAAPHVPRDTIEYVGSEIRLLQETEQWEDILKRMKETAGAPHFPHVYRAGVTALLRLDRPQEVHKYCIDWMQRAPQELAPAASIVYLHSRRAPPGLMEQRNTNAPIMQFWHSATIPDDVRATMQSWPDHNPGWDHVIYDSTSARDFFVAHLDSEAVSALDLCYHPAMTADLFRIGFLYVNGGIYVDADELCLKPVSRLIPDVLRTEIAAPLAGSFPGYIDNFFVAARAGGEVLQSVLQHAIADIHQAARESRRAEIWQTTGPGALTRGVGRYLGSGERSSLEVALLPMQQYRGYVSTAGGLDYKRDPAANWRVAELA